MITSSVGQAAETLVADRLTRDGWQIIDRNWRRRRAEIDIIGLKDKVVYFVEVKYRSSDLQGGGMEYITPAKLKQMKYGASLWVAENAWDGDWRLLAASVNQEENRMVVSDLLDVS